MNFLNPPRDPGPQVENTGATYTVTQSDVLTSAQLKSVVKNLPRSVRGLDLGPLYTDIIKSSLEPTLELVPGRVEYLKLPINLFCFRLPQGIETKEQFLNVSQAVAEGIALDLKAIQRNSREPRKLGVINLSKSLIGLESSNLNITLEDGTLQPGGLAIILKALPQLVALVLSDNKLYSDDADEGLIEAFKELKPGLILIDLSGNNFFQNNDDMNNDDKITKDKITNDKLSKIFEAIPQRAMIILESSLDINRLQKCGLYNYPKLYIKLSKHLNINRDSENAKYGNDSNVLVSGFLRFDEHLKEVKRNIIAFFMYSKAPKIQEIKAPLILKLSEFLTMSDLKNLYSAGDNPSKPGAYTISNKM